jgi:biotin transport system ATP-binding protein
MRHDRDEWLVLQDVVVSRGRKTVFSSLSFECAENRIGLVGHNGSGKSTLLRLLNGLLSAQSGRIDVAGVDVRTDVALAMRHVGFVFQNPDHQIVFPTVLEEMTFGFKTRGYSTQESEMRAIACLERYGCRDWIRASVEELSEGQRQKLCILAVLALEPSVIALDEPFASLDLPTRLELNALLASLPQRVIVASHDLDLLRSTDRVIWLGEGRIMKDGSPGEVIGRYEEHGAALAAAGGLGL